METREKGRKDRVAKILVTSCIVAVTLVAGAIIPWVQPFTLVACVVCCAIIWDM